MTTRLAKTTRGSKTPSVVVYCPACRTTRRCRAVGAATVQGKRREILQCSERSCELTWVPTRSHLPEPAAA